MLAHKLTLPDGTALDAGTICSVQLTRQVSDQDDLAPGAACAACAVIELWAPENGLTITPGTQLILTCIDTDTGTETRAGIFLAETPEKVSANVIRVTAYDRMTLLDRDLSPWLRQQQDAFPMTLTALVRQVCGQCGVPLADGTLDGLPNGSYPVQAFYADDLTGRQLIQWAAQAFCRFAHMTPDGSLEFAWYTESALQGIGPGSGTAWAALNLAGQVYTCADGSVWTFGQPRAGYLSGSLSHEDFETALIDKVQIKQSTDDVGVLYPPEETGTNALVLSGNLLLTTASAEALRPVAQAIYEQMQGLVYTPATVDIQAAGEIPAPGTILTLTDAYGRAMRFPVMEQNISGQAVTLEATGNARRDATTAVNRQKYTNLQGKLLEISADVDGLKVTAKDLTGQYTELSQTVDSITLTAETDGDTSKLVLSANGIELTSANITFDGMVTYKALSTPGATVINGSNVFTGKVGSEAGNTVYDLDAGTIRTGRSNSNRVNIDDRGINWYIENGGTSYLTGVLYSVYGSTYIGCNSRYSFFGWFSGKTPSFGWSGSGKTGSFCGLAIDQVEGLIHCNANKFEIPGRIECSSLSVNGREI